MPFHFSEAHYCRKKWIWGGGFFVEAKVFLPCTKPKNARLPRSAGGRALWCAPRSLTEGRAHIKMGCKEYGRRACSLDGGERQDNEDLPGSDSVHRLWALRTDQPRKFRPGRGEGDGKGRQGGDGG